jgi:hypothetical protein
MEKEGPFLEGRVSFLDDRQLPGQWAGAYKYKPEICSPPPPQFIR